jgi:hypothetical protein
VAAVQYPFTHKQYKEHSSTVHIYTHTVHRIQQYSTHLVETRWQQYSIHLHTNNTQKNTMKQNTQNRYTQVKTDKHKLTQIYTS